MQERELDERNDHDGAVPDASDKIGQTDRLPGCDVIAFGWQNSSGCGLLIGDTSPTLQTEKVPAVWPA